MIARIFHWPAEIEFEGDLARYPEGDLIENIRIRQVRLFGHELLISSLPEAVQAAALAEASELEDWTDE